MFTVSDQRVLLLGRENGTKAGIAQTVTAIAEKQANVASLARQLSEMKISANSPAVASTVARLGKGGAGGGTTPYARAGSVGSNPPLLLIRVYQDSLLSLVKYNADLAGLFASLNKQKESLASVQTELASLSRDELVFHELTRDVAIAKNNAETAANRVSEQHLRDEVNAASLTAVRILQRAQPPLETNIPGMKVLLPLGLVAGAGLGLMIEVLREMLVTGMRVQQNATQMAIGRMWLRRRGYRRSQ